MSADSVARVDGSTLVPDQLFSTVFRQMRRLAGPGSPELLDLVQAACEQVILSLPAFEGRCEASTWTWQICYRVLLNHQRWYRRWARRFLIPADGELPDLADGRQPPAAELEARERVRVLREAVSRLSPKRRAVVVLHDLEGIDLGTVALIVEANVLTVRSRLRDGRKDLAALLRNDPYFGDDSCEKEGEP